MLRGSLKVLLALILVAVPAYFFLSGRHQTKEIISPLAKPNIFESLTSKSRYTSFLQEKSTINILLLGIDRRSKVQAGFNTDTMILISINPTTNKVLLTSVPRDLWVNGNKINALYMVHGWETLKDAFNQITGQEIHAYIMTDFEDFRWIIDSMGGVPVDVQNSFTDSTFPNNADTDILTVSFNQGVEKMDGDRALTFARSRKGSNGEGSDLMRAKRQHLVLKGLLEAIKQPESIFWPMDVEKTYKAVTNLRMETTLKLEDVYYLWDFYKDKDSYDIESFVVDDRYVYHPGMYPASPYSAWVFVATEPGFANLHKDITDKLNKTYVDPTLEVSPESAGSEAYPSL